MSDDPRDTSNDEQLPAVSEEQLLAVSEEQLSALIDGELPAAEAAALRARVAAEPALVERLAELERVDVALRALPALAPSPRLAQVLRDRIAQEEGGNADDHRGKVRFLPVWAGAGLAAAAALAAYLLLPLLQPGSGPTPATVDVALTDAAAAEAALEEASEEELGIALDYDTLADLEAADLQADLDVIEDLELLELLAELDESGELEAEQG